MLLACEADSRGRTGFEARPYPQRAYLAQARDAAARIKPAPEALATGNGEQIAERLRTDRLAALAELRASAAQGEG